MELWKCKQIVPHIHSQWAIMGHAKWVIYRTQLSGDCRVSLLISSYIPPLLPILSENISSVDLHFQHQVRNHPIKHQHHLLPSKVCLVSNHLCFSVMYYGETTRLKNVLLPLLAGCSDADPLDSTFLLSSLETSVWFHCDFSLSSWGSCWSLLLSQILQCFFSDCLMSHA
jgi:hypothetical protein